MKVRCINDSGWATFTKGIEYEVIRFSPDEFVLTNNHGYGVNIQGNGENFELIPDEPAAPKSDWMQCNDEEFVNIINLMDLVFYKISHTATLYFNNNHADINNKHADAFADLVGYKWSDK